MRTINPVYPIDSSPLSIAAKCSPSLSENVNETLAPNQDTFVLVVMMPDLTDSFITPLDYSKPEVVPVCELGCRPCGPQQTQAAEEYDDDDNNLQTHVIAPFSAPYLLLYW